MIKVTFWLEAGGLYGLGHLNRCAALAYACQKLDFDCEFIVSVEAAAAVDSFKDWPFRIVPLSQFSQQKLLQALYESKPELLILDGYTLDLSVAEACRAHVPYFMVLDDGEARLTHLADIIVNPLNNVTPKDYKNTGPNTLFCLGDGYRLLLPEYAELKPKPINEREELVVCFGGSDVRALTGPFLTALEKANNQRPVTVITGSAVQDWRAVAKLCRAMSFKATHIHACDNMAEQWGQAKLAVSAAGGSQFELGASATPSILITVANNQMEAALASQQQGWCKVYDYTTSMSEIVTYTLKLLNNHDRLKEMQVNAIKSVATNGAQRLASQLQRHCCD